jgi:CBS domain containing-hemolysin-like protein
MNWLLAVIFIIALGLSFLFSGMEAGVFALSRLRIRQQMRAGNPRAAVLHGYLERPEDFLWTIMVGNTIANFAALALISVALEAWLGEHPLLFALALLGAALLFYALFELLPKTLFRLYPNRLCMLMAVPFGIFQQTLKPLVWLMAIFSRSLLRWSGGKRFTGDLFGTRDEFRLLMQESAQNLSTEERRMISRVLDLQNLTVRQIAIPLNRTVLVPETASISELLALFREKGFSRLPVTKQNARSKQIAGLVNLRSLIYEEKIDPGLKAGDFLKPALFLSEDTRLETALQRMQRRGHRLAIVLGRDQVEIGIVSLHDVLKVIFGEQVLR